MLRLELADAVRSRWASFTASVYGLLFGTFVWLGLRESSVLGFTGLSRVILNMANAVVLAVPLVALVATCQTIVRARQSGLFELMMVQPVRRSDWFFGAVLARMIVVTGPLFALFALVTVVGSVLGTRDAALISVVLRSLMVTGALSWAFVGLGFWVSAGAKTPERATVLALLVWLTAAALHDFAVIGLLLRLKLPAHVVFILAGCNPVEAARIAILGTVDSELSVLGPVGFWLAHVLGHKLSFAVGCVWPALIGTLATLRARHLFRKTDLVV
jgi:ABC-2 type transport system permease protein